MSHFSDYILNMKRTLAKSEYDIADHELLRHCRPQAFIPSCPEVQPFIFFKYHA